VRASAALESVIQQLLFAAWHYAALTVFVIACWGFGQALLARLRPPVRRDLALEAAMACSAGVGLFICLFQALAMAGQLKWATVLVPLAVGVIAALWQAPAWWRAWVARPSPPRWRRLDRVALAALLITALPAVVTPLAPPFAFDELMYHLPYAREVAGSGRLGVYEWMRYPWFPYNYNLLYAAALLVTDDVMPHLVNGLAGALSVWMVYRLGAQHASRLVGLAGAAVWLGLGDYSNALIDMGVALFVLAACTAAWWWREASDAGPGSGLRWLALSAFFLGVAAGSKYQALTVLPLLFAFVAWRERRARAWALMAVCFLLPCIYWYGRNALSTGDPFNPIGGRAFGFSNWNATDYLQQWRDVRDHANWPSVLIWPVLLAPLSPLWKRSPAVRAAGVFCAYSLAVWAVTSRYPRYMTVAYPLLSLMAVLGWQRLLGGLAGAARGLMPQASRRGVLRRAGGYALAVLLVVAAGFSLHQTWQAIAGISPTQATRDAFLRANVPGYAVMQYLRGHARGRVYQIALSEAIYYGPSPIWGDMLGPWRYEDYITLPPAALATKLAAQGFEAIVVAPALAPNLRSQPDFDRHFALMYEQDGAQAWRILAYRP